MAEYMCQYYSLGFCFVFSPVESLHVTDQQFVGFSEITGMECKTFGKLVIFPSKMLKSFFSGFRLPFPKFAAWRKAVSHPCLKCQVR